MLINIGVGIFRVVPRAYRVFAWFKLGRTVLPGDRELQALQINSLDKSCQVVLYIISNGTGYRAQMDLSRKPQHHTPGAFNEEIPYYIFNEKWPAFAKISLNHK